MAMPERKDICFRLTSDLSNEVNSAKMVEEQLIETCVKLNETEVNVKLLSRMIRNGVATNDVRNFVTKQAGLKRMDGEINCALTKKAMKSKFVDACSLARELRKSKAMLRNLLVGKFKYSNRACRRLVASELGKLTNHRHKLKKKAMKKYHHCESKMKLEKNRRDFEDIPTDAWSLVKGVNLFQEKDLRPEKCAEPMVCAPDIILSEAEMAFLRKGPRFMLRPETNEDDFKLEIEKMTVKEKMSARNETECDTVSDSVSSGSLTEAAEIEAAKAAMVYIKSEKALDLGKMKVTDYKFNRHVFLPRNETVERESLHELRRVTMVDAFREFTKENKKEDEGNNETKIKIESNLSKLEQMGLKSLKKRVQNEEIVITETDKSKRFCILKKSQYVQSGSKHTQKDVKVSHEQVKTMQNLVNDHSGWLRKIFNLGAEWNHEERLASSMTDRGEVVAPLYLLVKDHKGWSYESGTPPL